MIQTATFAQPSATEFGDYDYTRSGNPTRDAAQKILAEVDNGCAAYCFTTGMAAIMVVTRFAEAGQNIILSDDSYGGTYRLLAQVCSKQGVPVKYVDMSGADGPGNLAAAMNAQTALVMCESPTNPLMRVCPLRALADVGVNLVRREGEEGENGPPSLLSPSTSPSVAPSSSSPTRSSTRRSASARSCRLTWRRSSAMRTWRCA